ncbi:MAG: HAD family phosphatase [Proteobacteria bacterium]|nr:HAD family phosphatase [Pseudomonadota bacterium]
MPALMDTLDPLKVRAAVFDLGGVLINVGGPAGPRAFGSRTGLDKETWDRLRLEIFGDNEGPWARLERAEMSWSDFNSELRRRIEVEGGHVTVEQADAVLGAPRPLGDESAVRQPMIEAVRRLAASMPVALLTNNVAEWRQQWQSLPSLGGLFNVIVDSSEVGTRKPEQRIYELTRERLAVDHEAILFVDDLGINLKAARSLGWQTVLYTSTEEVVAILDQVAANAATTR